MVLQGDWDRVVHRCNNILDFGTVLCVLDEIIIDENKPVRTFAPCQKAKAKATIKDIISSSTNQHLIFFLSSDRVIILTTYCKTINALLINKQ